ncbi:unnamed protein product [Staurois parvus]|uniref:Uncharacterized protein n=1 Tax=Staurois parvus TaxID=386267 RepID=A0ABN9E2D7_9NEOB|nr:unnamed protein product [Staurois parvus]
MRELSDREMNSSVSFFSFHCPVTGCYKTCKSCKGRGGLTIWKLGHCPRARGQ